MINLSFYLSLSFSASQVYTSSYAWMYPFEVLSQIKNFNFELFLVPLKSKLTVP